MKAAVLETRGKQGLRIGTFDDPTPRRGEAVMKVKAGSINRIDIYMRDCGKGISHQLPLVLGVDGAGEIVEAPKDSPLKAGDSVVLYPMAYCGRCRACARGDHPNCVKFDICGETRHGTFAEYIAMPEKCFVAKPKMLDWPSAGVLPVAYLTAWRMVFGKAPLSPAETIVIMGIGGGVASACLQMAKMIGARAIVTSSTKEKLAWAEALGADRGINYREEPVAERVMDLTDGQGADMVIDNVGEASWKEAMRSLRAGGRIVTCGATTGAHPSADIQRLFTRQIAIYGSTLGSMGEFHQLLDAVSRGLLDPLVDKVYRLSNIEAGFVQLEEGKQMGKLLVDVCG